MRGAHRTRVVALLFTSGVLTGGLLGFFLGAGWALAGLPPASPVVAAVAVAAALVADLVVRPLDVRRQVPQLWGRMFSADVVAVLYGARLGVGPLTILTTWLWWGATAVAVTGGPWVGAASGAAFHVARTVTMLGVVAGAGTGPEMGRRMAAVQRSEGTVRLVVAAVVGVAVVAVVAAALLAGGGDGDGGTDSAASGSAATRPTTSTTEAVTTTVTEPEPAPPSTAIGPGDDPNPTVPDTTPEGAVDVDELRAVLLDEVAVSAALPGVSLAEEQDLDLQAAAELELDAAAERSLLQTRRFEGGVNRSFDGPGGAVAYLQVYEFATPADAEAYLEDGIINAEAAGATPFAVEGIDGAQGFTSVDETDQGAFTGHVVTFVRGARHFLVVVGGTDGGPGPDAASRLAADQLAAVVEAED